MLGNAYGARAARPAANARAFSTLHACNPRAPAAKIPPVEQITQLRLDQVPPQQATAALIFMLAVGLVYCFAGYSLLRFIFGLTGFLIAGTTAAVLGGWLSHGNLLAMGGALLFGGICGAMALVFLYRLGVFLIGFISGMLFGFAFFFESDASFGPVMALVAAFVGGFVALFLERPVMKLATAAIGGWLCAVAGLFLCINQGVVDKALQQTLTPHATWILLGVWVFLTLLGATFQFSVGNPLQKNKSK